MSVSRREFMQWAGSASALALTLPGAAGAIPFAPGDAAAGFRPELMPSADQVWDWMTWMAKLGPKFTGNAAHTTFVEFLATKLQAAGLSLTRDHYTLPMWEARSWSVKIKSNGKSEDVPTTGYYPYSGQHGEGGCQRTDRARWSGQEAGGRSQMASPGRRAGQDRARRRAPGADPVRGMVEAWGFTPGTQYPTNNMNGTWAIRVPPVGDLKAVGARGVIFAHQSISDEHAALLVHPVWRRAAGHARIVGRPKRRRAAAEVRPNPAPKSTLMLDATVTPNTPTDTLLATLPGTSADEVIIVNTHTDGNNATEENGGVGILALAQYFCQAPADIPPPYAGVRAGIRTFRPRLCADDSRRHRKASRPDQESGRSGDGRAPGLP